MFPVTHTSAAPPLPVHRPTPLPPGPEVTVPRVDRRLWLPLMVALAWALGTFAVHSLTSPAGPTPERLRLVLVVLVGMVAITLDGGSGFAMFKNVYSNENDNGLMVDPQFVGTVYVVDSLFRDVPESARLSRHPVTLARPLGPHPKTAKQMGAGRPAEAPPVKPGGTTCPPPQPGP